MVCLFYFVFLINTIETLKILITAWIEYLSICLNCTLCCFLDLEQAYSGAAIFPCTCHLTTDGFSQTWNNHANVIWGVVSASSLPRDQIHLKPPVPLHRHRSMCADSMNLVLKPLNTGVYSFVYTYTLTQSVKNLIFILLIVEFLSFRRNKVLALLGIGLYGKLS